MDPIPSFHIDSQPSQILREVLRPPSDAPKEDNSIDHNSWMDDDSNPSGSAHEHQYHYHGLAVTQTQSQINEPYLQEDSQKENTPATVEIDPLLQINQSPLSPTTVAPRVVDNHTPIILTTSPCVPSTTKTVSFVSPRPNKTITNPGLRQARSLQPPASCRRSASPDSQDSFAGPTFRKDPEQEFLAASRQFGIPLSELGTSLEDSIISPSSIRPSGSTTEPPKQTGMVTIVKSQSSDESQGSEGAVLQNADTQNEETQEQAQDDTNYDDYIVNNHNREAFIERDSLNWEDSPHPSSSSEPHDEVPTQIIGQFMEEPTQILGQAVREEEPTQPVSSPCAPSDSMQVETPATIFTNRSTATRGIQSLVGHKKWRARGILPLSATDAAPEEPSLANMTPQHSSQPQNSPEMKRTQAMVEPETQLPELEPTQPTPVHELIAPAHHAQVVFTRMTPPPSPEPQSASKAPQAPAPDDDNMDIVPDSEPPRSDLPPSDKPYSRKQQAPLVAVVEDDEIIPDSIEDEAPEPQSPAHEEEEEEPPRRLSGRVKRRAVYTEESSSESDVPLAITNKRLVQSPEPISAPPPKKRKLDTSAPASTRARKVQDAGTKSSAKAKAKPKKTTSKSKAKGKSKSKSKSADNSSESVPTGRQTPSSIDDTKTEPAFDDEDYMAMSFRPDEPGPSRKRKMAGSATKKSSTGVSITPSTRSTKLRSAPGSLKGKGPDTTRVFAKWTFSGYYYHGTIHSRSAARKDCYIVHFEDDTECDVALADMRRCEFIVGDNIHLITHKRKSKVISTRDWEREGKVRVEIDGGVEVDVEAQDIRISSHAIATGWMKRTIPANSIVPFLQAQSLKSSPSKLSLVTGTSSAKFLKHLGFVVTLSPGNENWAKDRDKLVTMIEGKGGTVISDWSDILEIEANHSSRCWIAGQENLTCQKRLKNPGVRSVFLLADEPNQKPKFLIALALGIPCVSINWLKNSIEKDSLLAWAPYLLPAGLCGSFDVFASQRVDLGWGDKTQGLNDILVNPLASKLFWGKSVLCIGEETFPILKRNNSDEEKQKEPARTVPRIVLAMGAESVEAVADYRHASADLSEYDYVLVKDVKEVKEYAREGVTCVHLPWMKECLIASQLLPLPDE